MVTGVKVRGSLVYSNLEMMGVQDLEGWDKRKKHYHNPRFLGSKQAFFRDFLGRIQYSIVLERRRIHESWLIFRDYFLQDQQWSIPMSKNSSKGSRRIVGWTNKDLH